MKVEIQENSPIQVSSVNYEGQHLTLLQARAFEFLCDLIMKYNRLLKINSEKSRGAADDLKKLILAQLNQINAKS